MTFFRRALSLSPGNEQRLYWGSENANTPGTRNLMGVASPAVDGLINAMLASESHEDFVAATRALDRVLTAGRYVIPIWNFDVGRIAHAKELKQPQNRCRSTAMDRNICRRFGGTKSDHFGLIVCEIRLRIFNTKISFTRRFNAGQNAMPNGRTLRRISAHGLKSNHDIWRDSKSNSTTYSEMTPISS